MRPLKCKRHLQNAAREKEGIYNPELLIVELLDENNQPVAPGKPGEVTITTLGVEGMPLLRYKTGDICIAAPRALCMRPEYFASFTRNRA